MESTACGTISTSQIQLGWEELFDETDELHLQASQHFESSEPQPEQSSGRFGAPHSSNDIEKAKNNRVLLWLLAWLI